MFINIVYYYSDNRKEQMVGIAGHKSFII